MHENNLSKRTGSICSNSENLNNNNINNNNAPRRLPRRTSVTPIAQKSSRAASLSGKSLYTGSGGGGNSSNNTPHSTIHSSNESSNIFSPSDKLRRMSMLFSIDRVKTREVIMAALEDPARTEFKRLKLENECLTSEWKQIRKILEQLQTDYETSRPLDPLRRYKSLQGMIKRIVMHIRINEPGSVSKLSGYSSSSNSELPLQGDVLQSEAKTKEMEKRIGQICENYTVEELTIQNRRLRESNERLENRLQLIVQTVNELDLLYHSSKSEGFLKRYTSLKDAVKRITTDEELYENP
uniref:Uncharacterized protein n=1 Tax=Trichobilharzia regenti TaxID=157069 RepID=A0AA85IUR5_TRIRE|nr:unnamed protein product [Trichobilharzia regenti]CAH8863712.1 unnamed protein product [Trichobilharzia regenti]